MSFHSLNERERKLLRRACHEAIENIDGLVDAYTPPPWGKMHPNDQVKVDEWKKFIEDLRELVKRL